MNKQPELPDFSKDLEIVQALQKLSGVDVAVEEDDPDPNVSEPANQPS